MSPWLESNPKQTQPILLRSGHIEEMVLNKEEASHESKCFRRCMLKQFEIMGEGQMQFDEVKTVDMMNMMFPEKEANSKSIAAKCNQAANGITDE